VGRPTAISLYTGAGGLDLGLEAAGFDIKLCVEIDVDARSTLQMNRPKWKLSEEGDIHSCNAGTLLKQARLRKGEVTLLCGGPPCQPFSKSAYWVDPTGRGLADPRASTLLKFFEMVELIRPRILLLENVLGLANSSANAGFRLLTATLKSINRRAGTNYLPNLFRINSADYGVPQVRERVFLIASIDGGPFALPPATHGEGHGLQPLATAWDALGDLDSPIWAEELSVRGKWAALLPSVPEGCNYLWHTSEGGGEPLFGRRTRYWTFLLKLAKDRPSWTIQAQPGPSTGPFHWRNRLLSVRELGRLQTFPDEYEIVGGYASARRQLGNAVPCAIGEILGLELRRQLLRETVPNARHMIPSHRDDCPPAEEPERVPYEYRRLVGRHADHPGVGLGPGARKRRKTYVKRLRRGKAGGQ
jgi:DNA (cytosine-5)-methyltransferase 1